MTVVATTDTGVRKAAVLLMKRIVTRSPSKTHVSVSECGVS